MARLSTLVALLAAAALLHAVPAAAVAPGDPDTTFGTGGEVLLDPSTGLRSIDGLAEQPDGKLLAAGSVGTKLPLGAVLRLRADGTPDPAFGTDGVARIGDMGSAGGPFVQPDGRVVAWSAGGRDGGPATATLVRLLPGGGRDASFGTNGVASAARPGFWPRGAFGLADGGVVLVGSEPGPGESSRGVVVRFGPDGQLDTDFGSGGFASLELPGQSGYLGSVTEQPGGGIVVAGEFKPAEGPGGGIAYRWTAARFTGAGVLDASFGEGGLAQESFRGQGGGFSEVIARPDGMLVLTGSVPLPWQPPGSGYGFARLDANGHPDPTFGDGGLAYVEAPVQGPLHAQVPQAAPLADGRLALAGQHLSIQPTGEAVSGWVLGGLDAAGRIDPGFGREGWAATTSGPSWLRPQELLRSGGGKLVLAADSADCDNLRSALMRFHADDADRSRPDTGPVMRSCTSSARATESGRIPLEVQCPAVELGCTTRVEVEILRSELTRAGSRAPAVLVGVTRRLELDGGETAALTIRARSEARRIIAKRRKVRARILFSAVDRRGYKRTSKRSIVLKAPKKKR